jgi:acyl carrier protein
MEAIEGTVRAILAAEILVDFAENEFGLDEGLQEVFGIDSVGLTELRLQCEDAFGVEISDDYFSPENFESVRSIGRLVRRLLEFGNCRAA